MKRKGLYDSLIEYGKNGKYPFHMPGHKRNQKIMKDMDPFQIDITEIDGFDNLHHAEGIIKECMDDAKAFYGTKRTFLLVNGSTCGLLASIFAVTDIGDTILVGRNCHKAVYNAVKSRNLKAEYIYPEYIKEYGINGGYSPQKIKEILEKNKEIKAVVLTSPTYEGMVSDIEEIAELVHKYNVILIVDEAHGAHFGLSEESPVPAYKLGADITIESLHKTLPAMTQTAVLHIIGERVCEEKIEEFLGIFETSSPSYVLMASIDRCIRSLKESGKADMEKLLSYLEKLRIDAKQYRNIKIPGKELVGYHSVFDVDETKLVISVFSTTISGRDLSRILREKYEFEMEMEGVSYTLALCSICDDFEQIDRLFDSLKEIDVELEKREGRYTTYELPENEQIYSIYDTGLKPCQRVKIEQAEGLISAEFIYLYPPGIPLLVPGEKISKKMIEQIKLFRKYQLKINGLEDKRNEFIKVVKD